MSSAAATPTAPTVSPTSADASSSSDPAVRHAAEIFDDNRGDLAGSTIRDEVTPHTLRYTCIASRFAAGADQEYVAAQVVHDLTVGSPLFGSREIDRCRAGFRSLDDLDVSRVLPR
jgi:hypothetical protein